MIPLPVDENVLWSEHDFNGNRKTGRTAFAVTPAVIRHVFDKLGKKLRTSGTGYFLAQCPFHPDRDASLSVRSDGKYIRCFSQKCSAHTPMDWATFASELGIGDGLLTGGVGDFQMQVAATAASIDRISSGLKAYLRVSTKTSVGYPPRCEALPPLAWRELSYEYLNSRGAKWWSDVGTTDDDRELTIRRIVFPVRHHPEDDPVSWIAEACKMKHRKGPDAVKPKCRNEPGSSTQSLLFGLDTAVAAAADLDIMTVVLVEGPYDQMRFDSHGIPTAAILGTGSWVSSPGVLNAKGQLLLEGGFRRVIVCMDRDGAGDACRDAIVASLRPWFDVEVFELETEGDDPGSCPASDIRRLKAIL